MFVLHLNSMIDCTHTLSSFAQHEALETDLEGARQEIDRLSSELEKSKQQSHNLERLLTEKETMVADLEQQKRQGDLQNLEDKTQLLQKGMQEHTALNVKVCYISDA
jgi:hypothetical protein